MPENKIATQFSKTKELTKEILHAYAAVVFLRSSIAGAAILLMTFALPNVGLAGIFGALLGITLTTWLRFERDQQGLYIVNCLLVGMAIGAFYDITPYSVLLLLAAILGTVIVTVLLRHLLWKHNRLPAMSLPFVIVAFCSYYAALNFSNLSYYLPAPTFQIEWIALPVNQFLQTLGAIFFAPHTLMGTMVLLAILFTSRYLAFLCLAGYVIGIGFLYLLVNPLPSHWTVWSGFNFSLTAMALGGILTVPSKQSFAVAMGAVLFSVVITSALFSVLAGTGLPVMAVPFLISTLVASAALKLRTRTAQPIFADPPALPEDNYERARLAEYRNGDINSFSLLAPFFGEWTVYQGMDGPHTHQGEWRYALDFYITKQDTGDSPQSYQQSGTRLEDYYCFGLPVVSPVYGEVIRCMDQLIDNAPGEMDTQHNWGNFILIRLESGQYVMLAHLRQHSIKVKEKQRVVPGDILAACGNSGRSPQPHLHLQVQQGPQLHATTHPFHLASVLVTAQKSTQYQVVSVPKAGNRVEPAVETPHLAEPLHLPVGRELKYLWREGEQELPRTLTVKVTLDGQYRLHSNTGASAAFAEMNGVLAFYDRTGPKDHFLNAWLLAMGLTPLSESAATWQDAPSARLFPASLLQNLWLAIRHPLGCGLQSHYQRQWDDKLQSWRQTSTHQLPGLLAPVGKFSQSENKATCEALLNNSAGCYEFHIKQGNHLATAKLDTIGLISDEGIPGWKQAVAVNQADTENSKTPASTVISHE